MSIQISSENLLIAKNLATYRRKLKEEIQGKRAELMRYIWGERGMQAASRAEILEKKAAELYELDCRISAVDELIRKESGKLKAGGIWKD